MSNSLRTTNLGPWVSFSTTKANAGPVHVVFPSGGTVDFADVAAAKFSNITTASPVSTFIPDGFLSIVSHSGNSLVIAIRSGATTYRWTNDAGGVL
jgi:hypothetical protein